MIKNIFKHSDKKISGEMVAVFFILLVEKCLSKISIQYNPEFNSVYPVYPKS